jgi:hypothetical protein
VEVTALTCHFTFWKGIKGYGRITIIGWKECRVKDMSEAGALILTKHRLDLGDEVQLELSPKQGAKMVFEGDVVNLGIDHATKVNKIGIRLTSPRGGTTEATFLIKLEACFKPSHNKNPGDQT